LFFLRLSRANSIAIHEKHILLTMERGANNLHKGKYLKKKNTFKKSLQITLFKSTVRPDWSSLRVYHWIGLEKNINRYMFFIFYF
jgi:hypothetical protein